MGIGNRSLHDHNGWARRCCRLLIRKTLVILFHPISQHLVAAERVRNLALLYCCVHMLLTQMNYTPSSFYRWGQTESTST